MLNNTISLLRRVEAAREKQAAKGRQVMTREAYRRLEAQLRDTYKDELHLAHEAIIETAADMIRRAADIEETHRAIDSALHILQYDVMDDPPRYRTAQGFVKICHANDKRLPALHMDEDIMDIVRAAVADHIKNPIKGAKQDEQRNAETTRQSKRGQRKKGCRSRRDRKKD